MADTSLIFSIIARDKTSKTLLQIRQNAASTGSLVAKSLGPALAPVAGVGAAAVMGLGASMVAAGAAAGVFGAVLGQSMTEISENSTKFQDLTDKVELYGRQASIMAAQGEDNSKMLKKQAAAALELKARLSLLPPETRNATTAFMGMKSGWQAFVDTNKPATFNTLTGGYRLIGQVIAKLQPFFDIGRAAADRLVRSLTLMVNRGGIEKLAANAGPAMETLTSIIINVSKAITGMFSKFSGQGQGMLKWIESITAKWAAWATSTEKGTGIQKFVEYVNANGGQVKQLLVSIGAAAVSIAQALGPLAPISLAIASALAAVISAVPPAVIQALVVGYIAWNVALKAWAIGAAIQTAAQWAMNTALLASPVTWIVLAIVALIAVIVLVATKTRFFQTVWNAVWGFLKAAGTWVKNVFVGYYTFMWNALVSGVKWVWNMVKLYFGFWYGLLGKVIKWVGDTKNKIVDKWNSVIAFFKSAPGKISGALSGMFRGLWTGFKSVVNRIIGGWNSLSFGIPGFSFAGISVPGISVGTPNLPYLDRGAGMVKQSGLAVIHRGESVTPAARVTPYRSTGGGGGTTITFKSNGSKMSNLLLELVREAIRDKGGDPVKVLTPL